MVYTKKQQIAIETLQMRQFSFWKRINKKNRKGATLGYVITEQQ